MKAILALSAALALSIVSASPSFAKDDYDKKRYDYDKEKDKKSCDGKKKGWDVVEDTKKVVGAYEKTKYYKPHTKKEIDPDKYKGPYISVTKSDPGYLVYLMVKDKKKGDDKYCWAKKDLGKVSYDVDYHKPGKPAEEYMADKDTYRDVF